MNSFFIILGTFYVKAKMFTDRVHKVNLSGIADGIANTVQQRDKLTESQ